MRLPRTSKAYEQSLQQLSAALDSTLGLFAEVKQAEEEVRSSQSMGAPSEGAAAADVSDFVGTGCVASSCA